VHCYDSSDFGRGVVVRGVPVAEAASVGRTSERSRFARRYGGVAPRAGAIRQLDPFRDAVTVMTPRDQSGCDFLWERQKSFPEVPVTLLAAEPWQVVASAPWRSRPVTHEGEARCCVQVLEAAAAAPGNCGSRRLSLGDNLGVVLAFERHRAHAFPLLV
jgi:hypothetical protein